MKPEIVVGIPTYREVDSIAYVVRQVDIGLSRAYGARNCLIVNVDNESDDGTGDVFLNTRTACSKEYISTGCNPRGKGKNLLKLLNMSLDIGAKHIMTIDADIVTVGTKWASQLLDPIINDDIDYTTPIYTRNRFEGSTTNHFAFPLIYGVYGTFVRQPIGGEFGISQKFAKYLVKQEIIPTTEQYGIDMFITSHAVGGKFRIKEIPLGRKMHKPSFPKIIPIFTQEAHTGLHLARHYWRQIDELVPVNIMDTFQNGIDFEQRPPSVDSVASLLTQAKEDFLANSEWKQDVLGTIYDEVKNILMLGSPRITSELWARFLAACVYKVVQEDYVAEHLSSMVDIIRSVFLWRTATLWDVAHMMSTAQVEREIRHQAEAFRRELSLLQP